MSDLTNTAISGLATGGEQTSHEKDTWDGAPPNLNPASEPWFPSDVDIDWNSFNIPDPVYDHSLILPQDFLTFPSNLPPVNYYPAPVIHQETIPGSSLDNSVLKRLEGVVTELMEVKIELEAKVQQLARNFEESNETVKALRTDVDATENWCEQLRTFIEDNFGNCPAELRSIEDSNTPACCERQETEI